MNPDALSLAVAGAPIVLVLLLLVLRVPSLWAGAAGLVTAIVGAALAFPVSAAEASETVASLGPLVAEVDRRLPALDFADGALSGPPRYRDLSMRSGHRNI